MTSKSHRILKLTCGLQDSRLIDRIKVSNILLVGAGGIGCEVLKGLLLTGFPKITIIDLDTIDVSNLNRQFLYNKTHVGQSKAEVAARISVERFAHRDDLGQALSEVIPIHDSILNLKYDRQFYQKFTFVINALDNNATRVHVNRMCLTSDLPLIESGSAGYFGNVTLIKGGVTKCFECTPPKKDENSYASCTIRNTPSLPIHCIVWAKHLFAQLFGQSDEDISPDATVLTSPNENSTNNHSSSTTSKNEDANTTSSSVSTKRTQTTRQYVESINYDPKALFDKIFYHDILYLKEMKSLWENRGRKAPQELFYEKILNKELNFDSDSSSKKHLNLSQATSSTANYQINGNESGLSQSSTLIADQQLWTMQECLHVFCDSLSQLKKRLESEKCLEWDKDDDLAVNFVAAVSNFRCHCFYIPRKSKFEVKSLAGNIIPAISSTNTIVGGYILLQTIKLLQSLHQDRIFKNAGLVVKLSEEDLQQESMQILKNGFCVFISNKNLPNLSKIAIEKLSSPKHDCIACSKQVKEILVELPFERLTLADLIEQIVIRKLKTVAPDINCYDLKKMVYAADDEDDLKDNDSFYRIKTLASIDYFKDNICLNVKDLEQDFEVNLRLKNVDFTPDDEEQNGGELFRVLMNEDELKSICDLQQQKKRKFEEHQHQAPNDNGLPSQFKKLKSSLETIDIENDDMICLEPIETTISNLQPN